MKQTEKMTGNHWRMVCVSISMLLIISCDDRVSPEGRSVDEYTINHAGESGTERLSVFFTEPDETVDAADPDGSPVGSALVALIERQKSGVLYLCCYSLDYQPVINAFLDAVQRGVTLYFVGDVERIDDTGYRVLKEAIVNAGGSKRQPLGTGEEAKPGYSFIYPEYIMHNKFVLVTDSETGTQYVWTGSTNISKTCMLYNNNNAVIVQSGAMYDLYLQQFAYLYDKSSEPVSGIEHVSVGNLLLSVIFSYNESGRSAGSMPMSFLESLIQQSGSAVYFMSFSFTHTAIAQAVANRVSHGVKVRGVFDRSQQHTSAETISTFEDAAVGYRIDGNEIRDPQNRLGGGKLHHKCLVVDPDTHRNAAVVTGSANHTHNAEYNNAENTVIIYSRKYAQLYADEFRRCWDQGAPSQKGARK